MILALAVALGLLLSAVRYRGEAVQRLASLPLRWPGLVLLALALQLPLLRAPFGPADQFALAQVLFLLSHLLLLGFVWANRRTRGVWLVGLGIASNLAAILANGGWMPITPETLLRLHPGASLAQCPVGYHYGYTKDLILARESTHLWLLSDLLVLPPPFPWPAAFSLGDFGLAAGLVLILNGPRPAPASASGQARPARTQKGV